MWETVTKHVTKPSIILNSHEALQKETMIKPRDIVNPRQVPIAKLLFALYDNLVLGFVNRFVWQCPTRRLLDLYDAHASNNHLEVGVGTGYFIDRCRFQALPSRLVILDLNGYTLAETAWRLRRYRPLSFKRSILEPLDLEGPGFDSVGINYVLHCLPGTIETKAVVFEHMRKVMNPGAVLFGSTTLTEGIHKNQLARLLMDFNNRMGIFHNQHDTLSGLQKVLSQHFTKSHIEVVGCSGVFVCNI